MDAGPATRPANEGPESPVGRIPALDGIRAMGIVLVLFFHAGFGWAGGGFFGVDVFFVLSGFLITGLLISEFRKNSHIGLKRFWAHRVRRLLPALLALLGGVAIYGVFFAPPDTLSQLRGDAVATLLYGNNWHQINGAQGYFAALNTPRPLLHTWSLSIEEQFYLVWPVIVLAVLHWTRSLRVLLSITVVGAAASATLMAYLFHGGAGENRAYYGTDTRAQGLLIGAALAILLANPVTRRGKHAVQPDHTLSLVRSIPLTLPARATLVAVGGVGLAVVLWMSIAVSSATHWVYYGGFAGISLATAAVVACVALLPASPWARALSLRPVRYVGAISYGLYLWHWPIFVLLDNARTGLLGWPLFILRAAVSVGVAAISYRFLEMPIRRGALRGWRGWATTPLAIGGTAVLVVASTAGATTALGAQNVSSTLRTPPPLVAYDPGTSANVPPVPAGTAGPIRALLVGDSEAGFLGFGLGPAAPAYNVSYAGDGVFGCGLMHGETLFHNTVVLGTVGERGGQLPVPCSNQLTRWRADLSAFHPDVVLLDEGEYEVRDQLIGNRWVHIGQPAFDRVEARAIKNAVEALRSSGARVVLLTAVYYHQLEQADGASWPEDNPVRVDRFNAMLRRVAAAAGSGVVVEDLNAHLDPGRHYAQFVNGVNVRFADGIHVDTAGATLIAPWLMARVVQLGTADRAPASPITAPARVQAP